MNDVVDVSMLWATTSIHSAGEAMKSPTIHIFITTLAFSISENFGFDWRPGG